MYLTCCMNHLSYHSKKQTIYQYHQIYVQQNEHIYICNSYVEFVGYVSWKMKFYQWMTLMYLNYMYFGITMTLSANKNQKELYAGYNINDLQNRPKELNHN